MGWGTCRSWRGGARGGTCGGASVDGRWSTRPRRSSCSRACPEGRGARAATSSLPSGGSARRRPSSGSGRGGIGTRRARAPSPLRGAERGRGRQAARAWRRRSRTGDARTTGGARRGRGRRRGGHGSRRARGPRGRGGGPPRRSRCLSRLSPLTRRWRGSSRPPRARGALFGSTSRRSAPTSRRGLPPRVSREPSPGGARHGPRPLPPRHVTSWHAGTSTCGVVAPAGAGRRDRSGGNTRDRLRVGRDTPSSSADSLGQVRRRGSPIPRRGSGYGRDRGTLHDLRLKFREL